MGARYCFSGGCDNDAIFEGTHLENIGGLVLRVGACAPHSHMVYDVEPLRVRWDWSRKVSRDVAPVVRARPRLEHLIDR